MSAQPIDVGVLEAVQGKGKVVERVVRVGLKPDGYPKVEPDSITINRDNDERVVWQAEKGVNFTICFEKETPFDSFHYHSFLPSSGSVRKEARGKEYKYSVEVNGKVTDPKVQVEPPS